MCMVVKNMKNLLKTNELRRYNLVEALITYDTWVTTADLANIVGSSKRVIINDIAYLRENYDAFRIESSYQGIRLNFKLEANLKNFYQKILKESVAFSALEMIFFNKNINSEILSEKLYISESTLYRLTREIDETLMKQFNISLRLSDFELEGDEQDIRHFYYLYFSEKYPNMEWPFDNIDEAALDELLNFFINFSHVHMNYAYYRNFKIVTAVNLTRVLKNSLVSNASNDTNLSELIPDFDAFLSNLKPIFSKLGIELSFETILQIFNNYVRKDFALNYDRLITNGKKDPQLLNSVYFINHFLDEACQRFDIFIPNKKELIWRISNSAHNEVFESHSGYILCNRNRMTLLEFEQKFPEFYDFISLGLIKYRSLIKIAPTQFSIDHLIFQVFICWGNLLPQLQNKWQKVKVLLISDINNGHGSLIKDQIEYYFNHKIMIEIYDARTLTAENVLATQSDMVISTFSIPILEDIPIVCLNSIPTAKEIKLIDNILDDLISKKQ